MKDEFGLEYHVKATYLSRKPRENSLLVGILSVAVLFMVSQLAWNEPGWFERLSAVSDRVFQEGEWWRPLTTIGVHSNLRHLLSNAVLFGFFSYLLYGYFGPGVYPALILAAGWLTNLLSLMTYSHEVRLVGASGVVYLMTGFWLMSYLLIERKYSVGKRLIRVVGLILIVLVPSSLQPQVSYRTHAIGMTLGLVLGLFWYRRRRMEFREAEEREYELPLDEWVA